MRVRKSKILSYIIITFVAVLSLISCGGGGNSEDSGGGGGSSEGPTWTAGVYENEDNFKDQCENPRSGTDLNGNAFPDQSGSTLHENHWLRSWSNNTYLWYSELPDIDPATESNPTDYFDLLKTPQTTASGTDKDNFHFFMDTAEYRQRTQSGVSVSYGIDWELRSASVPRSLFIRYIEPGSPADAAALNLTRGVQIIEIDGINVENDSTQAGVDILNAGLFPDADGDSHTFMVRDVGASTDREVTIVATEVTSDPVPVVNTFATDSGNVGYLLFFDHNFVSEDKLYDAMTQLSNNNVTDLILDVRYNGGGYLYIASQLSYMIAGSIATNGKTFEELRFNDKYPDTDPVTGDPLSPTPFYTTISQYSDNYAQGTALPQLNLNRVFILATDGTCSASEAIINGLRGIDVEVILIGNTTCGKPYGFYPTDNCGTTYFTIQFDGINEKGSGGYSNGFSPMNTAGTPGELVTGCSVADDLSLPLGELQDPLVSAAMNYRVDSSCPAVTKSMTKDKSSLATEYREAEVGLKLKLPVNLNNKVYIDPYNR